MERVSLNLMLRVLLFLSGIVLLIGMAAAGSFLWDGYVSSRAVSTNESIRVVIPQGTSVGQIARILKEKEIIQHPFFFKLFVQMRSAESSVQAGTFALQPGTSFQSLLGSLSNARSQEVQMTLPEGLTAKQIGALVTSAFAHIDETSWLTRVEQAGSLTFTGSDILKGIPVGQGLEGYLFPDTYRLRSDADAQAVIETLVVTLKRRLAENNIVVPDHLVMENSMTFHDVLTLASIVEREVQSAEDMARVADIFLKRLKMGMALQADSTVNYIIGGKKMAVSLEETQVNSPYNTYKYLGLPPGPISNPGIKAIRAVLQPMETKNLYFLTIPSGEVIYAKTFDEHVANKYKYLKD